MQNIKVGDVVAWADVPDGAMVRPVEQEFVDMHAARRGRHCCWLTVEGWREWDDDETWMPHPSSLWRLVAIGLTGSETASDLRALAERFNALPDRR